MSWAEELCILTNALSSKELEKAVAISNDDCIVQSLHDYNVLLTAQRLRRLVHGHGISRRLLHCSAH